MSWNRPTFCPILISSFLGLTACHNNAHLRTQKIIEPGEKVYSASGILAVGGDDSYNRPIWMGSGISGLRGEVSMLTGIEKGEKGPYGGVGLIGGWSYIAGYEYKKYMRLDTDLPFKLGIQAELNLTPGNEYNLKMLRSCI